MNWSEVFNSNYSRWTNQRSAQTAAAYAGYPFYLWNNLIYYTDNDIPTVYIVGKDDSIIISYAGKTAASFGVKE